jgi:hypothetical protein
MREIKNKEEELFTLIADTERRYKTSMKEFYQNVRMLQELAVQIDPRPDDPTWYYFIVENI